MYRGGLISIEDLSNEEIEDVLDLAREMSEDIRGHSSLAQGMIMASLFFEPSTRTRGSFESAMNRLGGRVISTVGTGSSSMEKGRDAGGYHKGVERVFRRHCAETPVGGFGPAGGGLCISADYQRRRRRPRASHADLVRPVHAGCGKGNPGWSSGGPMRRPEARQNGTFADFWVAALRGGVVLRARGGAGAARAREGKDSDSIRAADREGAGGGISRPSMGATIQELMKTLRWTPFT